MQARGFRALHEDYRELGAEIVGVSRDKPAAQARFADRQALPFPLLCDVEGEMVAAYGVRGLTGHAKRVSFLIGADGRVAKVYPKVSVKAHPREVLEDLRALRTMDG